MTRVTRETDNSINSYMREKQRKFMEKPVTDVTLVTNANLGMSVEDAIALWRSEGAPIIHLGPGENCEQLDTLLSRPDVKPDHLVAVRKWLCSHCHPKPEGGKGE